MAVAFQANKKSYLDEEAHLHSTLCDKSFQKVFQSWLDSSIAELDRLYETCELQLGELQQAVTVDGGAYWNSKTLMTHCNLHIGEKRLIRKGVDLQTHPSWPDMVRLVSALNSLRSHTFISPQQAKFIGQVEQELRNVVFEPRELNFITNALETKLRDDSTTHNIFNELTRYQNSLDELSPELDSCEQLLETAMSNGDMQVAEDIANRQIDMYEHVLRLITEQYPVINQHYAETEDRKRLRRWAIFRMANRDITTVVEAKHRQVEACEEDLMKIKEQLENYSADDAFQRKRYSTDCQESDTFLAQNKGRQQAVWNKIYGLYEELQQAQDELTDLAHLRRKEIERRLRLEEREAGRRSGHEAFIRVTAEHAQLLQDTIDNAITAKDVASALNEFVLDGCDNVTSKFDRQQSALGDMQRLVQNHHFKRFVDFYLAAGRMIYRKEQRMKRLNEELVQSNINLKLMQETLNPEAKKFADEVRDREKRKSDVAAEIVKLRRRMTDANAGIAPTLRSFNYHNIKYTHPEEILAKINFDRQGRILDYREIVNPQVPMNDVVLREETAALLHRASQISSSKATRQRVTAPRPPTSSAEDEDGKNRYRRFQQLLERKLETPAMAQEALLASTLAIQPAEKPKAADTQQAPLEGSSLRALFRYRARAPDELSFEKGDIIICVGTAPEEGWYSGVCNQRSGLFPANYVTRADDDGMAS